MRISLLGRLPDRDAADFFPNLEPADSLGCCPYQGISRPHYSCEIAAYQHGPGAGRMPRKARFSLAEDEIRGYLGSSKDPENRELKRLILTFLTFLMFVGAHVGIGAGVSAGADPSWLGI